MRKHPCPSTKHECYDDGGHYYRHNECMPVNCGCGGTDWWIWIAIAAIVLLFIF